MKNSPKFPFNPASFPFFYGWVIVFAATIGTICGTPGQTIGVSVFTDYLLEALDIKRIRLSETYMLGTIASSLLLPFAGRLYDRKGARTMVVLASLGLGLTLLYLSSCDIISNAIRTLFGSLSAPNRIVEHGVLILGFFSLRFWGQGILIMISRAMLAKWFHRRRGFVFGLSGMVASFCFAMSPNVLASLIKFWGWRGTWTLLALCIGVGLTAFGWLFYRDNPEECGLFMDGKRPDLTASGVENHASKGCPPEEIQFTLLQAIRSYPFWVFNLGFALPALIGTAMTFHIEDLGRRAGMSLGEAVGIFPIMAFISIATSLIGGWLSDKIKIRYLLGTMVFMQAIASTGLLYLSHDGGRWLVIIGFGVTGGLYNVLMGVIWPRFYGRAHLGAISSASLSVNVFAGAVGPWLFALSEEWTGNYTLAAMAGAIVSLLSLLAALGIENPQRKNS